MATLSKLVVRVGADIADFQSDMGRAAKISRQRAQEMSREFAQMGRIVGAAAIGAGVAIGKMVNDVTKEADQFQKLTDRLGGSVEAFSELEFVAERSGVKFETLTMGLQRMTRRIAEAAVGSGEAKGALQELGLSAEALVQLPLDKQFEAIADELSKVENESDRARLAMRLFDSEGVALVQSMQDGAAGIQALRQEARDLGRSMSGETAQAAVTFRDTITDIQSAIKGVIRQIAAEALPQLQLLADQMLDFIKNGLDVRKVVETVTSFFSKFVGVIAWVVENVTALSAAFVGLQTAKFAFAILAPFGPLGAIIAAGFTAAAVAFTYFASESYSVANALDSSRSAYEKLTAAQEQFLARSDQVSKMQLVRSIEEADKAYSALSDEILKLERQMEQQIGQYRQMGVAEDALARETAEYQAQIAELTAEQMRLETEMREGVDALLDNGKAMEKTNKAAHDGNKLFTDLVVVKGKMRKVDEAAVRATGQLAQEMSHLVDWYRQLQRELYPAEARAADFVDEVARLNRLLEDKKIEREQFERDIVAITKRFNEAQGFVQETTAAVDEFGAAGAAASQQVALNFSQMATDIVTNSLNKIDDAFSNIWRDLVDGAGISFRGIVDAFKGMVAELLHTAITKPIVLRIGAMLGGVGGAGSAMAGQGGLLGSIFSAGGGGGGLFGGLGSLLGGGQIGNFFTNLPTWLGGTSANGMNMAGGLFGNAQNYSNWQYGIAGLLGGLGGQALFGGQGGLGGSLGSTIGMAAFGPIGALIGGLLGGFVGGLFGDDDPDPRLQLVGGNVIGDPKLRGRSGPFTDTALGGFYITNANDLAGDVVSTVTDALKQFDQTIATFLNPRQLEEATLTLRDWGKEFEGEGITVAEILESRFKQLRYAFNYLGVFDYVDTFDNLEDQMEAFGRWFTAFNQLGAVVGEYLRTDPREAADALKQQAMTSTETLDSIGMSLRDAIDSFDNTPESLAQIAQLVQQRYQGEIEYLVAIDQLVQGISASIEDQQRRIREAVQGPRSFDDIIGEAQTLMASLATAGSPEEIGQIVGQIQSLVDSAFRGLDSDAQAMQADFLIGFLDQVQQAAEARANILAEQVLAEGEILREELGVFAEAIGAPLDAQIAATQDVNASINQQTTALLDSDAETRAELRALREELGRLSAAQQAAVDEQSVGRRFATSS